MWSELVFAHRQNYVCVGLKVTLRVWQELHKMSGKHVHVLSGIFINKLRVIAEIRF